MLIRPVDKLLGLVGAVIVAAGCGSGSAQPSDAGAMDAPAPDPRFTIFPASAGTNGPWMIAAGPDGNLWFTQHSDVSGNPGRIGRVSLSGEITLFDLPDGSLPQGITAGPDGALWFADLAGQTIGRMTTDGMLTQFPLAAPGFPQFIVTGPDGNLWITVSTTTDTSQQTGNIQRMTVTGEATLFPLDTAPSEIAAGPDGNVWYVAWYHSAIGQITPAGSVQEFPLPAPSFPHGLVAGPDGNIWIAESTGVGRMTITGAHTLFEYPASPRVQFGRANEYGQITVAGGTLWFIDDTAKSLAWSTGDGNINEVPFPDGVTPVGIAVASDGSVWSTDPVKNTVVRFRP